MPAGISDFLTIRVAPYNMQVDLLRRTLPTGARVGTVDKFQGQEAEVVIVSMATSNGDHLPRNIEFLYSKNRLNVALSRARSLALLAASPALADISCATVEQMGLVNLVCGAKRSGRPRLPVRTSLPVCIAPPADARNPTSAYSSPASGRATRQKKGVPRSDAMLPSTAKLTPSVFAYNHNADWCGLRRTYRNWL